MKKKFTLLMLAFAVIHIAAAQSAVTSVSYNKASQPGLVLELPYNVSVSEGFIIDNLKKTGYDPETKGKLFWKQNKLNGFYVFKDVRLEDAPEPVDLFFKVEPKSRKAKDQSLIYLLVGKGEDHFISSTSDDSTYEAAKKFLNGFVMQSAAYKLDLDIKNQMETVKNAENKLEKLKGNEKDLNKKIDQLQEDLKQNQQDQIDQEKIIDDEKRKLEDLKAQTKKGQQQ